MTFLEIKTENALRQAVKQFVEKFGGIPKGQTYQKDMTNAIDQTVDLMMARTEPQWYLITATDEDLPALDQQFDFHGAYGMVGRSLMSPDDKDRLPKVFKKPDFCDIASDTYMKARSYMLIYGFYNEEFRKINDVMLFPYQMEAFRAEERRNSTQEQRATNNAGTHRNGFRMY